MTGDVALLMYVLQFPKQTLNKKAFIFESQAVQSTLICVQSSLICATD